MAIEHAKYNKTHFKEVCGYLDEGQDLTMEMIGHVFGAPYYLMELYNLMDAGAAARAIQLASARVQAAMMQKAMEAQAEEAAARVPHSPLVTEA